MDAIRQSFQPPFMGVVLFYLRLPIHDLHIHLLNSQHSGVVCPKQGGQDHTNPRVEPPRHVQGGRKRGIVWYHHCGHVSYGECGTVAHDDLMLTVQAFNTLRAAEVFWTSLN